MPTDARTWSSSPLSGEVTVSEMSWSQWDQAGAEFGIPAEVRSELRQKLESGQPVEAMLGGSPVSTDVVVSDQWTTKINRYEDGSVAATRLETARPGGGIGTRSISGCSTSSVSGGTRYNNCKVFTWVGTIAGSFYADYVIYTNRPDTITGYRGASFSTAPGTEAYNVSFTRPRATENSNGPAYVQLRCDYKVLGTYIGYASWRLYVGGNSAWDEAAG